MLINYAEGNGNDDNDDGGVDGNCEMTTMVMTNMVIQRHDDDDIKHAYRKKVVLRSTNIITRHVITLMLPTVTNDDANCVGGDE